MDKFATEIIQMLGQNGVYKRTLHTEYGDLKLEIPHNRNGDFCQQTIASYKRSNDTFETTVIHLFQKGITMIEIAQLIERRYGHRYSPQTVLNITQAMNDEIEACYNRQLSIVSFRCSAISVIKCG